MRVPTLLQVESALKLYGLKAVAWVLASMGILFHDRLVGLVLQFSSKILATIVVWLVIAVLVITLVGVFYIFKSRMLEKAVLKLDPNYYDHHEFGKKFDKIAKTLNPSSGTD